MEDVKIEHFEPGKWKKNVHPHKTNYNIYITHDSGRFQGTPWGFLRFFVTKDTQKVKEEIQQVRQKKLYRLRAAQDMWHGNGYSTRVTGYG